MKDKIESFIHKILWEIEADENLKKRIAQDLRTQIMEASQNRDLDEVLSNMGSPSEIAHEFMASMQDNNIEDLKGLITAPNKNYLVNRYFIEYRSKINIFGLPLVHIKYSTRLSRSWKPGIARGIVAIGNIASGIIAIGGISIGIIAIGGISGGVLAIGGLAAGLMAAGGISAGFYAVGGIAIGFFTIGGASLGYHSIYGANGARAWNFIIKSFSDLFGIK
ncbi:MAG: hypothetical protein ABSG94_01730 [Brevinematales bacterium]|jgi:hypothetical protein